jgi:hypothetical protein
MACTWLSHSQAAAPLRGIQGHFLINTLEKKLSASRRKYLKNTSLAFKVGMHVGT